MSALPVRVLIVDDSASVREVLRSILDEDPAIEVMGVAADPVAATRKLRDALPDVMLLDVEMPHMDGLTFLRKIMAQRPIPVIICSSTVEAGSRSVIDAFAAGAVDVVAKPRVDTRAALRQSGEQLRAAVHRAAQRHVRARGPVTTVEKKLTADAMLPPPVPGRTHRPSSPIICIGISTGGTETLRMVLEQLTVACPGIVAVQHMPENFTAAFARRLDGLCAVSVKEAADGDEVAPGRVLIAPGSRHVMLQRSGAGYRVIVRDGPPVSRHRPSADVLFRSAAQQAGPNALGLIMTGMGDDGARGLLEMRQAGARTLAQDEKSCVVFGMPKEAIAMGAVEQVVTLARIPIEIAGWQSPLGRAA